MLHVHNVDLFNPSERRLPPNVPSMETLHRLTSKVWCNGCPITRQGAMINRLNRSVVHELEQFCRTEVGQSSSHIPPPYSNSDGPLPSLEVCARRLLPRPRVLNFFLNLPHFYLPTGAGQTRSGRQYNMLLTNKCLSRLYNPSAQGESLEGG